MGETELNVIEDDGYGNELDAVLSGKEIPGDEFTGEIKPTEDAPEDPVEDSEEEEAPADEAKPEDKEEETVPEVEDSEEEEEVEEEGDPEEDNLSSLQSTLREQEKKIALLQAKLERLANKKPAKPAEEEYDENGDLIEKTPESDDEELTVVEALANEIDVIGKEKGDYFDGLIEVMSLNPKYADVEEVCSKKNLDYIVEEAAQQISSEKGTDLTEARLAVELHIWSKRNPYSYMYDIIKSQHPAFAEKAAADTGGKTAKVSGKKQEEATKGKKKVGKDAPLSALDLAKSGDGKTGDWTAEKIDNLPEHRLDEVPKDIYAKYLAGELDN